MKKMKYLILTLALLVHTTLVFGQMKQVKPSQLYQAASKHLKITGYINVVDKKSQDYIFMALQITRGNAPVKGLKVTLNGTAMSASAGSYNYQGSKHGVTIAVGTPIQVKVYGKSTLSLSYSLLATFNGKVKGIVKYIKPMRTLSAFTPGVPSLLPVKAVKIKWKFVGKIGSPVQYLRLREYPGGSLLVEKYNFNGTEVKFASSLFKKTKTYKISLLKPQHPLLKPIGSKLDPACEIGIRYIGEYEDAKTLLFY